jgi:hypothetical protein
MSCTPRPQRSAFVLRVETLGEAYRLGWRATACCIGSGPNPKSRHGRTRTEYDTRAELNMKTLIWTRGANLPLKLLESRIRCPQCGKLGVTVNQDPRRSAPPNSGLPAWRVSRKGPRLEAHAAIAKGEWGGPSLFLRPTDVSP